MKIITILIFIFCSIFTFSQNRLFAANVEMPQISSEDKAMAEAVAFDFIYSHTFKRKLKASSDESDEIKPMDQGHLMVSFAKYEPLQPYVKLGTACFTEKITNVNISDLGRRDVELKYEPAFNYGGGFKGAFNLPWESFFIGYDLQYLRSKHKLDTVKHSGQKATSKTGKTLLEEWHTAVLLGKKFTFGPVDLSILNINTPQEMSLTPYLGGRYSNLKLKIKNDIEYTVSEGTIEVTGKSKADKHLGGIGGLLINIGDRFGLNLEGRFSDETAACVSGSYKF